MSLTFEGPVPHHQKVFYNTLAPLITYASHRVTLNSHHVYFLQAFNDYIYFYCTLVSQKSTRPIYLKDILFFLEDLK